MKKLVYLIATWIKSLFVKKTKQESKKQEFPEIGTFEPQVIYDVHPYDDDSKEDKKQILKEFNEKQTTEKWVAKEKEIEHRQVLKGTYKKEKFTKNKKENTILVINNKKYSLTRKQLFFYNESLKLFNNREVELNGNKITTMDFVDMNDVCKKFIDFKFGDNTIQNEDMYKSHYHKSTINYLIKIGLLYKYGKNQYKVLFSSYTF
jgi:hypothetical protein